ncbi:hypothetical protein F4604DRAFT_1931411 [Suillus subluteus]|nr:hypothetical protein F4604DRAFT_1931411 [Suillus subluteus]
MSVPKGKSPASSSTDLPSIPWSSPPKLARSSSPPSSVVLIGSPISKTSPLPLKPDTTVYNPTLSKGTIKLPMAPLMNGLGHQNNMQHEHTQYALFPGDHDHELHAQEVPSSPTKKRKLLKTSAIPFSPDVIGQDGMLSERFTAAAAMMQMGPPIDILQDHQSRWHSTMPSQARLRPYSNPPLSCAASIISALRMSQTMMSTEDSGDAETSYSHHWRHAKHGSKQPSKSETHQITHYAPEDQSVIYWVWKLIIIDMIMVREWLTKIEKAILQKAIRECINQANAKYTCVLEATNDILVLVSQELSTVHGKLATISESHIHHYNLELDESMLLKDHQQFLKDQQMVLYDMSKNNFANYFLHWRNHKTGELVLFGHPSLIGTHLKGWYDNLLSLIYEESFRWKVDMTPDHMLTVSVAAVRCRIDRHVEGHLLRSGNVLQFGGDSYAHVEQGVYTVLVAAHQVHPEKIDKFLYDLHQRGLKVMHKQMGVGSPVKALKVYIPSADELSEAYRQEHSTHPEETPSAGPSTYSHFDQPSMLPYPLMGAPSVT